MSENAVVRPTLEERAEAAVWLARLRKQDRTVDVERGFRSWLSAEPGHERAFRLLTEQLEHVELLKTHPLARHWRRRALRARASWPSRPKIAAASVLALSLIVLGVWLSFRGGGVSTAVGEQRTLALEDGTRIYMNTNTRLVVQFDDRRRGINLKAGEALFEVVKDSSRPFIVRAGERWVEALGTSFVVRRDELDVAVTLIEGEVSVGAGVEARSHVPDQRTTTLSPGQRLQLNETGKATLDTPSLEKITAWRQGQVAIDDLPLNEAAAEMNRYSEMKLVIRGSEAERLRVGGFFRMGDSRSFARAVASSYNLQLTEKDGQIVLTGP